MNTPFLLIDGNDVTFFKTLEGLARYVESPDLDAYLAVDVNGLRVQLDADRIAGKARRFGVVPISSTRATLTTEMVDQSALRARLVAFLRAVDIQASDAASLEVLIELALQKAGFAD
jgi:hypothetical protein